MAVKNGLRLSISHRTSNRKVMGLQCMKGVVEFKRRYPPPPQSHVNEFEHSQSWKMKTEQLQTRYGICTTDPIIHKMIIQ